MISLLLIIYLAFIGLGLPDSLLGGAWPAMYAGLAVPIAYAGVVSMLITGGTIVSSLFSNRLIHRFDTGPVTLGSVALTAIALAGISLADSFWLLCLWAVPLGLGGGLVDAALNNFVALHYQAAHMNWLHCFWGIGAATGPVILSLVLPLQQGWRLGYRLIALLLLLLAVVLAVTLPLWRRVQGAGHVDAPTTGSGGLRITQLLRLQRARPTLLAFFCYSATEATVGLWGGSYLVLVHRVPEGTAARWVSLFYLGITAGRLLAGFLSIRLSQRRLIRLGQSLIAAGLLVTLLPFYAAGAAGLFCIGLGCAPIYPSLLHETPNTFGPTQSQAIMGIQMACAYTGSAFMPPLFGLLAARLGYGLFPLYLALFLAVMAAAVTVLYRHREVQQFPPVT